MRRPLGAVAAVLAAAALATTGLSSAAFVDSTETNANAGADHVNRWLGLEAPSAASCTPGSDVAVTGTDETAAIAAGGRAAGQAGGRTLDCSLVLEARDTLPDGATSFRVEVSPDPALAGQPLSGAMITALDGSGPDTDAVLAPGERAAVSITVRDTAVAQGALLVVVRVGAETTDFLRYAVPVVVCEGDLASSCVTPPTPPSDEGGTGTTGGTADQPQTQAPPATVPPIQGQAQNQGPAPTTTPKPKPKALRCTSRRSITIRLPRVRGQRVTSARVRVKGRATRVRRRNGRLTATIDLRRYPKQTVKVAISQRTASGRTVRSTRSFRTCAPKKATRP